MRGFTEVSKVWKVGEKSAIPSSILPPEGGRLTWVAVGRLSEVLSSPPLPFSTFCPLVRGNAEVRFLS